MICRSSYSNTRGCTDLLQEGLVTTHLYLLILVAADLLVALQEDLMYRYLDPLVALHEELRGLLQEDLENM